LDSDLVKILFLIRDPIRGRTMLQKAVFLVKARFGKTIPSLERYHFTLHYYGPFSRALADELDDLQLRGLVQVEPEQVLDVTRYNIRLTQEGKQLAQKALKNDPRRVDLEKGARLASEYNAMKLETVVKEAYRVAETLGVK